MVAQDQTELLRIRLGVLDAFVIAIERREELMRVVGEAAGSDEAHTTVMQVFGLDEVQAHAVLDLQVRRFATRSAVIDERQSVRRLLGLD
jgi:DNA gyrase/topoisomerase IV subunit A